MTYITLSSRNLGSSTFVRNLALALAVLTVGCGDGGSSEPAPDADAGFVTGDSGTFPTTDSSTSLPTVDSGTGFSFDAGSIASDAGAVVTTDASTGATDAGAVVTSDGGAVVTADASTVTADAGTGLPDLGSLFPPAADAGTGTPDPAVGAPGDPTGPCADLQLLCFDFIDMFIFNPELCTTCNGGKGCQGCAIPFAY